MLRLCYSNSFEELIDALCGDLREERRRSRTSLFTPARIIVPNHNVTAYVKLALAQRAGIAANLEFQFFTSFIAACVPDARAATPPTSDADAAAGLAAGLAEDPAAEVRVLDTPQLHALLCSVLADERLLDGDDMAPVRAYLQAAGADEDAVDLRRFQLAEQLASLFSDYRLSRPELVSGWARGLQLADTHHAGVERWQRRLWQALFDPARGLLRRIEERTGVAWVLGPDLFERKLVKDLDVPRHVYMIGFSYLPYAHHRILSLLARYRELRVYTLNPCMEFWEDLRAGWETRLHGRQLRSRGGNQAQAQLSFDDLDDTPALRLWGRPGRENVRILNELTQCDFDARFVDPSEPVDLGDPGERAPTTGDAGDTGDTDDSGALAAGSPGLTMLAALQRDILFRQPAAGAAGPAADPAADPAAGPVVDPAIDPNDDSIQILGCPSVQRELEVIGNQIWTLLARDPTLRFNDIALLVSRSELALYQAHIPAVFGELHKIPHHLAEASMSGGGRMVEALEMLLDLPFGRFTRPELLRLLTHPAVLARYPDVDPGDWVHWSERLGILHGADAGDHAGTYIERDLFNWQQGIRRLALGAFMAGEKSGERRAFEHGPSAYLPEELPADLLPSAARFSLIARSLIGDARYCRDAAKPLAQWRVFMDLLVSSYLAPTGPEDERCLAQCREAIATLASSDLDGRPVRYRIACELLRQKLGDLRGDSGEYLAHGVTVAPLLPMRPIPYRVVFLAGLGEGRFPAAERESPLDLRAARRRRGDVSPRERDRYLFLETLLSTRERLYITYVSRDDQTGETLQPSAVVLELAHILRRGYAGEGAAARISVDHPLRRYDPRYFPALFPQSGDGDDSDGQRDAPNDGQNGGQDGGQRDGQRVGSDAPLVSVAPAAHRQANALALRRHLEQLARSHGYDMPTVEELRQALDSPRFAALRARLGLTDLQAIAGTPGEEDTTVSISLSMVRRFLESPLQAWASAVLRLREGELEDMVARADEAFATPVLPMVGMLREVFVAHLCAPPDTGGQSDLDALLQRYRRHAEHLELSGRGPTGVFSDIDRERHIAILRRWHEHAAALAPGGPGAARAPFTVYSFGRAGEHADAGTLLPPIALTVDLPDATGAPRPVRVELYGRVDPVDSEGAGSVVLCHHDDSRPRHTLQGMVDQLALSAAGIIAGRPHRTTVLTAGETCDQHRLAAWTQDEAMAHLAVLVTDLLGSGHEYLLPCEAVVRVLTKPGTPVAAVVEGMKNQGRGFSCLHGPISHIDNLHAPDRAEDMIARRFGPLFERLQQDEAPARRKGESR